MKNIFLDLSVISEFLSDNTLMTEAAASILTLAELKQLKVYVTPFHYCTLYSKFQRLSGHRKILEKLRKLKMITRVIKVNNKIIAHALNSDLDDFGNALQYVTATGNKKIDAIVTNDIRSYGQTRIALFTPESFLAAFWNTRK
ncbi:MAG TPA: PIN domain-containing protein [Cyclobacteriaceae bacterium]|nr:PIN domain-containing protein [Cyclobacteriaceae bacterium]